MSTFNPDNYDFSFYTEVSGNFTVPAKCNSLVIIASGGGGGGGGGGGAKSSPTSQPGSATSGASGAAGGDTIITGSLDSLTFEGGAGGAAGIHAPSGVTANDGGAGQGGGHSGIQGTALPGQNNTSTLNYIPSAFGGNRGQRVNGLCQNLVPHNPYSILPRTTLPSPSFASTWSLFQSRHTYDQNDARLGFTSNTGVPGGFGSWSTSPIPGSPTGGGPRVGGGGGGGGMAYGVRRKMSVEPNEVLSLTVGSGGNGGNGGNGRVRPNHSPFEPFAGSFGTGGAGGFIHLFWNED